MYSTFSLAQQGHRYFLSMSWHHCPNLAVGDAEGMDYPSGYHHVGDCAGGDIVVSEIVDSWCDACCNHRGDLGACECHSHEQDGNYSVFAGGGEDGFGLVHDHEVAG
jgi:hypothetical protein